MGDRHPRVLPPTGVAGTGADLRPGVPEGLLEQLGVVGDQLRDQQLGGHDALQPRGHER